MDLATARARVHAILNDKDGQATAELDRRLNDLIAAARAEENPSHIGRGHAARFCLACQPLITEHMADLGKRTLVICPGDNRPQHREPGSCSECGQAPDQWCKGCAKCACVDRHDPGCPAA